MSPFYMMIGLLALVAVPGVISYNRFVNQRNLIATSWSDVETELQRRYDLIPNLVTTVKAYASHEQAVFDEVTRARTMAVGTTGLVASQAAAEQPLVEGLRRLFAVAEGYPALKASAHFLDLQRQLAATENRIQAARRFYNANVAAFNRRVQAFPSNLLAWLMELRKVELFQIEPAVRAEAGTPPTVA
jgi:LemA protein